MTLFFLHFENGWMHTHYNFFLVRSPAFYMVVGWLWGMSSNRRSVKEHLQKRKNELVIPYLWFSLFFILLDLIFLLCNAITIHTVYRDIYKTLCLRGIGTLWFLPALLGGEILFLSTRDKSGFVKILIYTLCFGIITYYSFWHGHTDYSSLNLKDILNAPFRVIVDVSKAFIFISIAFYFSFRFGKQLFNMHKSKLFISGITAYIIAFCLANFISVPDIANTLVLIIGNGICSLGMLLFFHSIETVKPLSKPFVYFGKNSLIIMVMHWALFQIALIVDKSIAHHTEYGGFYTVIYFLISLVLLFGIIKLINEKLSFLIGK